MRLKPLSLYYGIPDFRVFEKHPDDSQVFYKKAFFRNFPKFTGKHRRPFFNKDSNTLAQVFSCELQNFLKEFFYRRHPWDYF